MIRPLRQRHHRIFRILAIALPTALTLGIAGRKTLPVANPLAVPGNPDKPPSGGLVWEKPDLFPNATIQTRLLREHPERGAFGLTFSTAKSFLKPDLLVYWVAGNSIPTNSLPLNAQLLGAFSAGSTLMLPAEVATQTGVLVLYSLADHEIVDTTQAIHWPQSLKP